MDQKIRESIGSAKWFLTVLFEDTHPKGTSGNLYGALLKEEFKEWCAEKGGTPEDFKELCDVLWCCFMYAIEQNYPLEDGMAELTREYESKFRDAEGNYKPIFREDGKLLKGSGFKKADFTKFFKK